MNKSLLNKIIKESGYRKKDIAESIGVNRSTFYKKEVGTSCFNQNEIIRIKKMLNLSNEQIIDIFFS